MSDLPPMDGRVCLVTGGNSGIGEATAVGLARLGAKVAIVCRNEERGRSAVERIAHATGREVGLLLGDLGDLDSVRTLADEVRSRLPALHVLVNNAGVLMQKRLETPDGLETTFATNHLGPFLLTNLLLDHLNASGPARVVNVASSLHRRGRLDFDDLQRTRRYNAFAAYSASKLCNVLFTRELAKRAAGSGLTCNALHPGVIDTGLGRNSNGIIRAGWGVVGRLLPGSEKGARTSIYLAAASEVASTSGEYYVACQPKKPSKRARDDAAAARLWSASEGLAGLG